MLDTPRCATAAIFELRVVAVLISSTATLREGQDAVEGDAVRVEGVDVQE